MKFVTPPTTALLAALFLGSAVAAQGNPTESGGWGTLSTGASWERIEDGTIADVTAASALVRVTRQTWGPEAGTGAFCFDLRTGGPQLFYVESGDVSASIFPYREEDGAEGLPVLGLPLLLRAEERDAPPVVVAPDSRVELAPGDLLTVPNGSQCGRFAREPGVVFLQVDGFPTGSESQDLPSAGIEADVLDLPLGIATARPSAPDVIAAGRLILEPSASVALDETTRPIFFQVETGTLEVETSAEGGIVRRSGIGLNDPSQPLKGGELTAFASGDASYLPPGPEGSVTNVGDETTVVLSVAVVPEAAEE